MLTKFSSKKRIAFALIPLVLAVVLTLFRMITTSQRPSARQASVQNLRTLTGMMTLRMSRKADELQSKGVKEPELRRLLEKEREETRLEANKVLDSNYKKPFDMNSHATDGTKQ